MSDSRTLDNYLGPTYDPDMDGPRLDTVDHRVLNILMDHEWHTNITLAARARTAALHSSISRLRKQYGYEIESRRKPGAESSGVWCYRLVPEQEDDPHV